MTAVLDKDEKAALLLHRIHTPQTEDICEISRYYPFQNY